MSSTGFYAQPYTVDSCSVSIWSKHINVTLRCLWAWCERLCKTTNKLADHLDAMAALRSFWGRSKWKCLDDIWAAGQVETFLTARLWFLVAMDSSCNVLVARSKLYFIDGARRRDDSSFGWKPGAPLTTQYWHSQNLKIGIQIWNQSFDFLTCLE